MLSYTEAQRGPKPGTIDTWLPGWVGFHLQFTETGSVQRRVHPQAPALSDSLHRIQLHSSSEHPWVTVNVDFLVWDLISQLGLCISHLSKTYLCAVLYKYLVYTELCGLPFPKHAL